MATRFCPSCGGEFVASVDTCPDCEVDLVDERPAELPRDDAEPRTGQVEYELHEWAVESRVMLKSLLDADNIPHVWEGTDLLVPAVVEPRVDSMVAQVEATFAAPLDPDAPKVAYDIEEWDDALQAELLGLLTEQGIPYEIDVDGALVVHEEDEERVEAAFDEIEQEGAGDEPAAAAPSDEDADDADDDGDEGEEPDEDDEDEGPDEDDEGDDVDEDDDVDEADLVDLDAQDVMSDLFAAADRLKRKATDHEGVLTLVERSRDVRRMRLPYGFSREAWDEIVQATLALNRCLEGDDEEIEEQAIVLRDVLRPYV